MAGGGGGVLGCFDACVEVSQASEFASFSGRLRTQAPLE